MMMRDVVREEHLVGKYQSRMAPLIEERDYRDIGKSSQKVIGWTSAKDSSPISH